MLFYLLCLHENVRLTQKSLQCVRSIEITLNSDVIKMTISTSCFNSKVIFFFSHFMMGLFTFRLKNVRKIPVRRLKQY